jgi:Spx/MgsR family transcriptional regulator
MRGTSHRLRARARSSPVTVYGIPNCDRTRAARAWLAGRGIEHTFHDYKLAGIDRARLLRWCKAAGWKVLLNRSGTTFRSLPDEDKRAIDQQKAIALMVTHTSLIKRPVVEMSEELLVGFRPELYAAVFG